ncbi:uncharacterized protein METZ01_LOCUS19234 [marine metagenome]|uniref:Uncharacterized protein n=1 Tax=marine metagenome TaxID=408172 RepID=A0A381PHG3_9ZZZZ
MCLMLGRHVASFCGFFPEDDRLVPMDTRRRRMKRGRIISETEVGDSPTATILTMP